MTVKQIRRSAKMEAEEATKTSNGDGTDVQVCRNVTAKTKKVKIKPFKTRNDWVFILPMMRETPILLPANISHEEIGVVIGVSETILSPNGVYVKSTLEIGQVVRFSMRAIVESMEWCEDPYKDMKIHVMSERNIFAVLGTVDIELVP